MSAPILKIWTTSETSSPDLRAYCHSVLNTLIQCRPSEFLQWGIDVLVSQLEASKVPDVTILQTLKEACLNKCFLYKLVSKKPVLIPFSAHKQSKPLEDNTQSNNNGSNSSSLDSITSVSIETDSIICRFAAIEEGVKYLESNDWLSPALVAWKDTGCSRYVQECERSFALKLTNLNAVPSSKTVPIPIDAREICDLPSKDADLEGLLRLPWSIEVKQGSQANSANNSRNRSSSYRGSINANGMTFPPNQHPSPSNSLDKRDNSLRNNSKLANFYSLTSLADYINIDAYLDTSSTNPLNESNIPSSSKIVKIRGIVVDKTGHKLCQRFQQGNTATYAGGYPVKADKFLSSTLQVF